MGGKPHPCRRHSTTQTDSLSQPLPIVLHAAFKAGMDKRTASLYTKDSHCDSVSVWSPQKRLVLDPFPIIDGQEEIRAPVHQGTLVMLHGWAQNTHVFANRSKKLVKRLRKAGYRVIFLQAPHRLSPKKIDKQNEVSSQSREYAYGWFWYNIDDPAADSTPLPSSTGDYPGMHQSMELVREEMDQLGQESSKPPLFLLGFSQGAIMVHKIATLICDNSDNKTCSTWKNIRKCILISGFPFRAHPAVNEQNGQHHEKLHSDTIPSLHVIGTKDTRVSPSLTRQVYLQEPCFRGQYSVWEHDRGHVIPTDQAFCQCLLDFVASHG